MSFYLKILDIITNPMKRIILMQLQNVFQKYIKRNETIKAVPVIMKNKRDK